MMPANARGPAPSITGHSDRHAPRLAISVFGGVRIGFAGHDLPLPNRKARALLAYLALNGAETERRERLAGLLWSEVSEQNARASLRQVLFDIREALARVGCDAIVAGRRDVALIPGAIDLDWAAMLRDVEAARVPEILLIRPRAVDTVLFGYEDLTPMFQEWTLASRAQIQDRLIRALQQNYENDGLPRRQRRLLAEAALTLDPLHEAACRVVMRLAAEDGEIGPALRAYANLYSALGDELDMEPSAPTQELVAQIKQGCFDRSTRPPAPQVIAAPGGPLAISTLPNAGVPIVAILPFRSIGPDPVQSYFAEGVVEDTVRALATLREPVVISTNSTREFRDREVDLREVGRRLGVQYAVSGTVRMAGSRLRLSVELAEVSGGTVLWGGAYDTAEPLFFDAQDDIASSIARTLIPRLRDAELRRSRGRRPEDLSVYHLMLQARELMFRLERTDFERAGQLLCEAIRLDSGYAAAYTAAANWYSLRLGQGWSPDPDSDMQRLEAMARAAIGMDSANGRALAMLAHNRTILRREYDDALVLIDRALEASPNDAEALMWTSPTFAYIGESAEAVRRAERAIALSPEDPFMFRFEHFRSIAHYSAGDYEEAAYWGTRSARANPHYTSNLRLTAAALVGLGRIAEVRPLVDKVMELQPEFRISPMMARQAFRDQMLRDQFAQHLAAAGLPP